MTEHTADWRCHLGRHHHLPVADDNPEKRGAVHLECSRCGHIRELAADEVLSMRGATGLGMTGGF